MATDRLATRNAFSRSRKGRRFVEAKASRCTSSGDSEARNARSRPQPPLHPLQQAFVPCRHIRQRSIDRPDELHGAAVEPE